MALNKKDLVTLGKLAAKADRSTPTSYSFGGEQFSYADINEAFRKELKEVAGNYQLYRQNKNTVFEIMEEIVDDVLPRKVLDQYGQFAEIRTYAQGDKPVFVQRITAASRRRAKQFITKVGLAGKYEVFKLDGREYEIPTSAFGGAAQIGLEEFLDGRIDMADVLDIIMEGLDEAIYVEIERALVSAVDQVPTANKTTQTSFDEDEMDKLLSIADSYGTSTIYCTFEFAATMVPSDGWVSDAMRDQRWNNGYLANYKGHRVIVLPQSYEDETNSKKVIDPSYAYIIPTGAEMPVKVAFEGQTLVREFENHDWSREVQVYKKVGVGAVVTNDICIYQNTSLTR